MRIVLIAVVSVSAVGCSAYRALPPVEPLEVRARFDVESSGIIETELTERLVPTTEGLEANDVDPDEAQVRIDARIVAMPGAEARRILGLETGADPDGSAARGGGNVGRAAMHATVDELVARGIAEELAAPSLVSHVGREARVGIARQVSMVRGYRIAGAGTRFIGNPIVERGEVGLALDTLATDIAADGSLQLSIEVRVVETLGELRRVGGSFDELAEVAVQVPLACRQRLASSARLAAEEGMFAAGMLVPGSGDVLIVFADARTGLAVSGRQGDRRGSAGR